ncbi:pentatricopeptide repeat-containing protein At3g20730-like [Papaver somniferum]|nr:pentatricopeptide repeat-containing protein At3g20730-like [Papaver somniferum]XP_026424262.1 pentatricopeptide repeat-containing protein At3g20730-like [Papaver somniferum]XP_026424263.1 pentatricopeptide repeat-containing protein At3g20730-like [Papaver somniferum]XP_026424264.1 pentatricopeptide repeat-containing protein At3g20730-like [Papaver somniferum]XP_026424265.1 pentatricopeptide repeat-containing protein At3g20730-like [Papaver somniferum]
MGKSLYTLLPNFTTTTRVMKILHYSTKNNHPVSAEKLVSYLEQTCIDISSLKEVHAFIITSGLFKNHVFLGSKLCVCYAKCDKLTDSKRVFGSIIINNRNRNPNNVELTSLWNSTLVGYFRTGHFNEVLKLYCDFRKHFSNNINIDSSSITFGLKSCTANGSIQFGRGIHVDALKYNLHKHKFVGSSLIGFYSKYGCISDARQAFNEISERDVVVYTAMVTGYAHSYDCYEAFEVARLMQEEGGIDPNRVTLVSLLQAAANLKVRKEGRAIHGYAIRRKIDSYDEIIETSLMDMYSKCGDLKMSLSVFNTMNKRDISSWNALIATHVQIGQPFTAFELFQMMRQEDIMPDMITLANLLSSCGDLKFLRQGKSIHAYLIRTEVQLDLVATTSLIEMYSKCNRANQGRILFDRFEAQDMIMFNVMVSGYLQAGFTDKALETVRLMIEAGKTPNPATILILLSLSADLREMKIGKEVHAYIVRQGMGSNVDIANQLLSMYGKFGRIEIARQIFNGITRRDLVSWTSMITSYSQHAFTSEALMLFRLLVQEERLQPDLVTLVSLLQAISGLGCLILAKEVHGHIYRNQLEKEILIINSLLTTYAKCGSIDIAEHLFKSVVKKSQVSWNTMISAFGMHGKCLEALDLFYQMLKEGFQPDDITFTSILSACSHGGYVEEGWRIFQSMVEKHSVTPNTEHYNCVIDLFSRSGQLEEAYGLVQYLPPRERSSALDALLSSCRVYKNMEVGDIVGRELLNLNPNNSGTYTLLGNLYAEAGKWDAAARVREIAKAKSLARQPGYSMIESGSVKYCDSLTA